MKGKGTITGSKSLPASMRQGSSGSATTKGQKLNTGHLSHKDACCKGKGKTEC